MEMERPKITCEETDNGSFARFVVEPLEKGYGITLGNAMRRTLLSSLPGSAAIAVRIAGVAHEFSTIRGVTEDVVDIILNLKTMAVKCENNSKDFVTYLHLRKTGAGEITAKDFEANSDVEILTPDLHICTMDDGAVLEMDVMIGNGRGYVPSDVNKTKFDNIDFIAIDSIFSPVKRVNFNVESTRVGQSVNYDKLTLEIETNGTTSAREIVALAGKIVMEHVGLFVELCSQLASTDILAVDQACVDLVYAMKEQDRHALVERIESRHGLRQLSYMKELHMGNDKYKLLDIDNDDKEISLSDAVRDVVPFKE